MKVFLRYYVELPFPLTEVDRTITALPGGLLDAAARDANLRAFLMLGLPAATSETNLAAAELFVSLSAPEAEGTGLRRALEWLAVGGDSVDAVLCGDLELAELSPWRTQLAISAQYRPLPAAIQPADRMAAQRVGESTLKAFLDRLATYVQGALAGLPAAAMNVVVNPPAQSPISTDARLGVPRRVAR